MRYSNKAIALHEKTLKAHRRRSNLRRVLGKSSFNTFFVEPTNKLNRLRSFQAYYLYVSKTYRFEPKIGSDKIPANKYIQIFGALAM